MKIIPSGGNPLLLDNDTLNPYRYAFRTIRSRLAWDLSFASWVSRRRLKACRNRNLGQKAVILCNGPSLNSVDFSALTGIFTIGLNKINLLFSRSAFRPNAIVSVNPLVLQQNASFFSETEIELFLDSYARPLVGMRENVIYLHNTPEPRLAKDCSVSIHQGFTVTNVAFQIAFHLGFTDVAIVGCDHNFADSGRSNEVVVGGATDQNHFDKGYFAQGQQWQLPDLIGSEYFYKLAREVYEGSNRRIVNCTQGGKLELFPRMDLVAWKNTYLRK